MRKYWSLLAACFVSVAPAALGEDVLLDDRAQPAAGNPTSLYGRDAAQGVYVRDSAVAVEKFTLAERLEHLKEWDKSADVYMEILQGYPDRVVPSQVDAENRIYQYTSVASAVQERLAKWPGDGLRVYRARYESNAEALLEEAGENAAKLHRVVSLYFVTESAKRAALRLMDQYLENADFPAAAWLADRMLAWHPMLDDQRPPFLFRAGIAYHLAGDEPQARAKLAELKERFPEVTGTVRGLEVKLAESLAGELERTRPPTLRVASSDSWPIAFGSPDRARVPAVSAAFGARLFAVDMPETMARAPVAARRQLEQINESDRKAGAMTGVFPVVDRGEMFFHDNARIYAVNLESGTPLPGWSDTYDGQRNGQFALPAWSTPRGQQCTITVDDDAVYAVMAQPDTLAMQMTNATSPRGETRLVSLDRRSGRERWVATSRSLPAEAAMGRNVDFSGSPVVVGDTVYVMARGGKGMQFEDAYVLAFDAHTGASKWICYLASANTGWWDFGDFSGLSGQRVSHLAYWGGRLYAITNLGALAAIDAYDGTIVWLNLYPRDVPDANRMMGFHPAWQQRARLRARGGSGSSGTNAVKPWTFNPLMIHNGRVFALPSDGQHVLVYDAATGVEQKRIPIGTFDDADTLLGVTSERLILAAAKSVFCVNWPDYDDARGAEGNLFWRKSFAKAGYPDDAIRGRGFVTQDAVIIPTAWALHRLSMKDGRVEASYPDRAEFAEDEGAGNVLVMQDRLIVATPQRVNVYTDLRLAMEKLDAEVAAAPQQPEPRLRYAEIMSVAGKWDVALLKLDEAMALVEGPGSGAGSPARDRLFTDALTFAQRVARDGSEASLAQASAFFDRAAGAASTPSQHVNYRLTRAKIMKPALSPADELRLYQEILADAAMRDVIVTASAGSASTRPAGVVAERAINELLARAGRALYDPFESVAAERLEAQQQSTGAQADPASLLEIAREFPNARVAPRALHAAADAFEAAGEPRQAAQVLRQLLFKYPDAPQRTRTIEALARNYLAMPNRAEVAIARLAQGAARDSGARLSQPLKLPDGQVIENVSFTDAVKLLKRYNEQATARALPDMKLPPLDAANFKPGQSKFLPESPESVIDGVAALAAPLPQWTRHDRIVGYARERGLAVWDVGQTQPAFISDALAQPPRNVAWTGPSLLAWNEAEIAALGADDGRTQWKASVGALPSVDVVTSPAGAGEIVDGAEEPDDPQAMLLQQQLELEGRLVFRGNDQVFLNGRQVQLRQMAAPQQPAPGQPGANGGPEQLGHVRPLSDRVVFSTSGGRIVALDLDEGKILWQVRPADRGPTHLLASDDFVVARVEDGLRVQLLVFDAPSGQLLSRRSFSIENGAGRVPLNIALAPDGTLVWIMPDRICGKDLFEPGDRLTFEETVQRDGQFTTFLGSSGPDHLQIADGRILVLSDNGAYVRAYSLETGKPLRSRDAELFFATGARPGTWQVVMRSFGRKLYIASQKEMKSYDLVSPSHHWNTPFSRVTTMRPRDVVVTQGYVVVVTEPAAAGAAFAARARRIGADAAGGGPGGTTTLQLHPFSRATLDDRGHESGLLEQPQIITDPATITSWQAVDGGFYYLTADQKLHFLQGAGK